MKEKILLFILLFLTPASSIFAQNTITLGTTVAAPSATGGPVMITPGSVPYYTRRIAIYTASEINSAGITSGIIQKIRWYKTDANGYVTNNGDLKIYVKHTSQSAFSINPVWATEISSATLVYSSTTQNFMSAIGWQEFILSTPFIWNGTDNLEVFVDWVQQSPVTSFLYWQLTVIPNMAAISGGTTPPSTINRNGGRPNIQLEFMSNTVTDAGVASIAAPVSPVLPNVSRPVQVVLRNFGGTALTSATVNWSVNGVLQTPFAWSGSLAPATSSAPVTIGSFNFPAGSHTLCAWTRNPNGSSDFNPANDSSCLALASCGPLSGNYTINNNAPASATNFQSFTVAVQRLTDCGVSGPVAFNVTPGSGPYTGQLKFTSFPGTKDSVVFNGNGAALSATNTATNRAAILLDGAKRVIFRNVNLNVAVTGSTENYGFQLINSADSCTISGCNINLTGTSATYGIFAGQMGTANGNFTSHSTFKNNTINGGTTGIHLSGQLAVPATGNSLLFNRILNFSNRGIYLQDQRNALVHGNELTRPGYTGGGNFYGITLERGTQSNIISSNRLHAVYTSSVTGTSLGVGIRLINSNAPVGSENIVKNNLVYNFNTIGGQTGISNSGSSGTHIFHNTIYFRNQASTTSRTEGFSQNSAGSNIKFINNIISLSLSGPAKHYSLYFSSSASGVQSSNNVLFLDPTASGQLFTGFANSTDYATLAQWQGAAGGPYDLGSLANDPQFANPAAGNLRPTNPILRGMAIPLVQVPEDIDGYPRKPNGPDPGAYEFSINTGLAQNRPTELPAKVYPNPFSQDLHLQLSAAKPGNLQLVLRDNLGRTICRQTLFVTAGQQTVSPKLNTALPPGFYILEMELNGQKTQQKLVKQ